MQAASKRMIVGGVAAALGAVALAAPLAWAGIRADASRPAYAATTPRAAAASPLALTDAERRARLSARLRQLAKEGRGPRLSDPPRPSPRAVRSATSPIRPAPRNADRTPTRTAPSHGLIWGNELQAGQAAPGFTPPPQRTSGFNLGSLTRPRLDLKTPPVVPNNPVECLTQAIYYEARSESEEGQAAVAAVVMNRSRSGRYPRDVCQVVYQRNSRTCQFTFTCDGSIGRGRVNMTAWARAERIAREVYEGRSSVSLPGSSVNYHAHYVRPTWGQRLEQVRRIGAHIFYGAPKPGHRNPGADETPAEAPKSGGLVFVTLGGEPIPAR